MQDELVTYETAKLAKQKGFDESTIYPYLSNGKLDLDRNDLMDGSVLFIDWNNKNMADIRGEVIAASTQSLLQKWLREIHNIHVYVHNSIVSNFPKQCTYSILGNGINISYDKVNNDYEKILELGLKEALNLLPDVEL